jgi:hypothetical protein
MILKPQSSPQTRFFSTNADIAIFGGSAGGGKTWSIVVEPIRYLLQYPKFQGVIFRRETPQITNPGGLWDEAGTIYPYLNATPRQSPKLEWQFPNGSTIMFSHLQHSKDVHNWQGSQIAFIGFDELTHFTETQFWYMLSRNRSTCGVKPYIRATCNPDPDSFVAKLIEWWIDEDGYPIQKRSGQLRYFARISGELVWGQTKEEVARKTGMNKDHIKSLTFIPAKLSDNKILEEKDPAYRANLMALPEVERMRLLEGNWKAKRQGKFFKNPTFREWKEDIDCIMYIDPAFGGTNNTAISIVGKVADGWQARGCSWRDDIFNLKTEIVEMAKRYRVGSIYIETNGDKGASLREIKSIWHSCHGINERENKHIRIIQNVYHNWGQIYLPTRMDKEEERKWVSNLLAYEELVEPDDEADSLAGAMRRMKRQTADLVIGRNR